MPHPDLKSRVLKELRMTPSEYRRMFLKVKREADESWSQVTARLETMFTYYLRSREVQSFESLQELLIADRLKQLMPNDLRSLVTQQEVKGWLKPKDIAELAANFEEGLDGSRQSNYRGTALRNQHYRPQVRHFTGAHFSPNSGVCFGCGQRGHFPRDCEFSRVTATKKAEVVCVALQRARPFGRPATPSRHTDLMNNSLMSDPRIEIFVGDKPCFARIDSGADITVIRANEVTAEILGQSSGTIKLTGAFGQGVTARLMYVPLGLPHSSGSATQRVTLLCAVTDQLTTSASILLTPKDYECLRCCREELMSDLNECEKGIRCIAQEIVPERCLSLREQEQVSRCSNPSANTVQRTLEELPRCEHQVPNTEGETNTSLEDEREGEQEAQALEPLATSSMSGLEQGQWERQNSVGEDIIEESERLRPVTEISSAEEQKRDESLADAWRQAKEGSHGMVIDGELLNHTEQLDGNIEMAAEAVKSCGQVSVAAQASKLSPGQEQELSTDLHEYREVMTAPDPSKPFCLDTDALETAIGACLSQRIGDTERPVPFLSKMLNPSRQEWSTIERGAFAIVWALEFLGTWLFGTKVKIRTDHDPLTFLTCAAPSSARLALWALAIPKM
ncbi:hypothetical protein HPB50_021977 [Hyalomma asiaticum]|uniref:Uncharacterized protein n=1 Tax=Hyalomma asiaticum TaxID=266040 RepID=A0ACB7SKC1_HYAAI|nr:hypothetical protein HPB50_021977 [Hyalomma asiaticum]